MSIGLVITAAGSGNRFGGALNKVFTLLKGKPILLHTLSCFKNYDIFSNCIITLNQSDFLEYKDKMDFSFLPFPVQFIQGGNTRQDSVMLACDYLDTDYILIHDGARPNVSENVIDNVLNEKELSFATIPAIDLTDTIKKVKRGIVQETVDRSSLCAVQTPQLFYSNVLQLSYFMQDLVFCASNISSFVYYHFIFIAILFNESFLFRFFSIIFVNVCYFREAAKARTVTDEATLIERLGFDIKVVLGDRTNIKVTYSEDLYFLDFLKRQES
ncbi:hypothetical protein DID75_02775 [Candidatus Marinamargulisbacteria bacterium SCGC AG-410-N11]|nr:hypothetical protein DID75_02775 [Candidatus Marinamargulisbacteria bacterium SCGC AG-410-N11]